MLAVLGARHVLLARFDWRLHGLETHPYMDPMIRLLVEQVAEHLSPQQRVTAIHDCWVHVCDKHEGHEYRKLRGVEPDAAAGKGSEVHA